MTYKPYRVKKRSDAYKREKSYDSGKGYGGVKIFGFRSGAAYKMIPALLYYAFALYYVCTSIYGEIKYLEFSPADVVLTVFKYIFWTVILFSPLIFLSDFKYRDYLPFFKKHTASASVAGLILACAFCYFMVQVNIYCMSDIYKNSVEAYDKSYESKKEKIQKQIEQESSDRETIPTTSSVN